MPKLTLPLDRSGGVYREELMVPLRLVQLKLVPLRLGREESEESHESDRGRGRTPGSSASGSAGSRSAGSDIAAKEPPAVNVHT